MIVVGSQALRIGLEKIERKLDRVPVDLDLFGTHDEMLELLRAGGLYVVRGTREKMVAKAPDGKMVEIEYIRPGTSTRLYHLWAETMGKLDTAEFYGMKMEVASLEMLYSIKRGHRHSPRGFEKHVRDYNLLRGIFSEDVFPKVTALRYKETAERERLRTPSLNKTTKDFFDDKVSNRTFIHDQIHEVMAHYDRPMFERIKIDPDKVACSREKFETCLTYPERIMCVQEEAYVIALERAMIPMLFEGEKLSKPLDAYKWAVMRICTTLCSGWFREFALENYSEIMRYYNPGYVNKFLRAVEDGRIVRIK